MKEHERVKRTKSGARTGGCGGARSRGSRTLEREVMERGGAQSGGAHGEHKGARSVEAHEGWSTKWGLRWSTKWWITKEREVVERGGARSCGARVWKIIDLLAPAFRSDRDETKRRAKRVFWPMRWKNVASCGATISRAERVFWPMRKKRRLRRTARRKDWPLCLECNKERGVHQLES